MTYNPEVGKKMDAAQKAAENELKGMLSNMTAEQKQGATLLTAWLQQNYMKAGYKRLSRTMFKVLGC